MDIAPTCPTFTSGSKYAAITRSMAIFNSKLSTFTRGYDDVQEAPEGRAGCRW